MKALGRDLAAPFDAFWDALADDLPASADDVERGSSAVFGDQGADATAPAAPRWASLPDDDLAWHVAREVAMRLLESRGYPQTVRGAGYPPDSAEARVGADLAEMVLNPSLHDILAPFGFRRDFILRTMADGALNGISAAPVPRYGSPWHFTWAIRHCLLAMELPAPTWAPIAALYDARAPRAAAPPHVPPPPALRGRHLPLPLLLCPPSAIHPSPPVQPASGSVEPVRPLPGQFSRAFARRSEPHVAVRARRPPRQASVDLDVYARGPPAGGPAAPRIPIN